VHSSLLQGALVFMAVLLLASQFPRNRPHFSPWSPVYKGQEKLHVAISVACYAGMVAMIISWIKRFGVATVGLYYLVPLFGTN
jgi:hypothetical protein